MRVAALRAARRFPLAFVFALVVIPGVLTILTPVAALAQGNPDEMARQTLGRPYVNVFVGYAAAWILIGGWVFSIARRLARVEKRLGGD
jgi:CcmD family protein